MQLTHNKRSCLSGLGGLLALTILSWSQPALSTYSIVAADRDTRQLGGAVTSCVAPSSVALVYGSAPGIGAVHAQAYSNRDGRDAAVSLLEQGYQPNEILSYITSRDFDPYAAYRQYGIVSFNEAVGFSGAQNGFFSNDIQRQNNRYVVSIQGNILTSARVLSQAEEGFAAPGCDLAERLMNALEAGARNGEGDSRCRPQKPSDAAYLRVDRPDGSIAIELNVQNSSAPLRQLRSQFNTWRQANPCQS